MMITTEVKKPSVFFTPQTNLTNYNASMKELFSQKAGEALCWKPESEWDFIDLSHCESFSQGSGCMHCGDCPVYKKLKECEKNG